MRARSLIFTYATLALATPGYILLGWWGAVPLYLAALAPMMRVIFLAMIEDMHGQRGEEETQ